MQASYLLFKPKLHVKTPKMRGTSLLSLFQCSHVEYICVSPACWEMVAEPGLAGDSGPRLILTPARRQSGSQRADLSLGREALSPDPQTLQHRVQTRGRELSPGENCSPPPSSRPRLLRPLQPSSPTPPPPNSHPLTPAYQSQTCLPVTSTGV